MTCRFPIAVTADEWNDVMGKGKKFGAESLYDLLELGSGGGKTTAGGLLQSWAGSLELDLEVKRESGRPVVSIPAFLAGVKSFPFYIGFNGFRLPNLDSSFQENI